MLSNRLAGKVALVTGIGSGIGQGCALMMAHHGARVVGCDIDADAAAATLAAAKKEGVDLISLHPCDLTEPAEVKRLIDFAIKELGKLDILVNAAATAVFAPIEEMDYEQGWRRTLTGELDVVFLACRGAWPHLSAHGGSIVNFASANAHVALRGSPALAHCAGKGGVLAMTRQLAMEGAPHNIRANTISPGLIVTGATVPVLERPEFRAAVNEKLMLDRLGQPEDIAWAVVFLASNEATWITGADFAIDGGATAW
jgi:NAD(P)-dependent dehydrogenase (short-subunit alcohol dehydrogenase family)